MAKFSEQTITDFYLYPSVGQDDWRYISACAQVRVFELQMLTKAFLTAMAGAETFAAAAEMLSNTQYSLGQDVKNFAQVETMLIAKRTELRDLFSQLMLDQNIVEIFKARNDFTNLKLAIRRSVTNKPIGRDYSDEGNVPAELFEHIFELEDYSKLPMYAREVIEQAVLAYYEQKDIRRIDYAVDSFQAQYQLEKAEELNSPFLQALFRMQIDLTNIRTMLRLKFTQAEKQDVFINGGYLTSGLLKRALNASCDAIGSLFFATPYQQIVEGGCHYFTANKSFLKLEQFCQEHLTGFLKSTLQITTGPQPVIAFLLRKENEIRNVRFILTAKKNSLDNRLIMDRLCE